VPPPAKAPARSSSFGLLMVLLLAAAAFVAAFFFRDRIFGTDDYAGREPPAPTPAPVAADPSTAAPTPPEPSAAPAALPSAAVRADEAPRATAVSPSVGNLAWTVEDGATVEAGAVVAKIGGFARPEARLAEAQQRGEFYARRLEAAQAKGDAAAIEAAQRKVDEKKQVADEAQQELERFYVKAPGAGTVKLLVIKGAAVKDGDAIAEIGGAGAGSASTLRVSFDAGAGAPAYREGAGCVVAAKQAQDRRFACVVEKVEGGTVEVKLVSVSGSASATPGDEVVLLPADTR
jgi:biotin carboxyl carrier protein